jgi:hypothetical protein
MSTSSIGTSGTLAEPPAARQLGPDERRRLAIQALGGDRSITDLALEDRVSRKFIYQQRSRAQAALQEAFEPEALPDGFLGWLPVTRDWMRRVMVSAAMNCHGSVRGIREHVEAITSRSVSEGTVHNVLGEAIAKAEQINALQDLRSIQAGAHDEIFSQRVPVLVGVEPRSTFVYLMQAAESRDEVAWWMALTLLSEKQGLRLSTSISDAGRGLQAGVRQAFPTIELRGDVLHAQMELSELDTYLENRAYGRLVYQEREERKMLRAKRHEQGQTRSKPLALARSEAQRGVALYDELHLLIGWMTELLGLVGPSLEVRQELYDWIVAEMQARASLSHRISPVATYLKNQRDALLAFVPEIQRRLQHIAQTFQAPLDLIEAAYQQLALDPENPRFEAIQRRLHQEASPNVAAIEEALFGMLDEVLRASSAVENINSILRGYFFLRRSAGPEFLKLLQFFLNHRRFRRSERPERVGKSPRELLTGQPHPHWLEMLGYPPVTLRN